MKLDDAVDTSQFFCPNLDCSNYGQRGSSNHLVRSGFYGKGEKRTQMLKCQVCGHRFSVRRGTALFGLKSKEEDFYRAIACLAEGNGIRATARIMGLDKDTISDWLERASKHMEAVSQYLMTHLYFEEAQLDEFWSFVKKKRQAAPPSRSLRGSMATSGAG